MENDLFAARLIMYATKKEWNPPLNVELRKAMQDGDATMDFVLRSLEFVMIKMIVRMDQMKKKVVSCFRIQPAFRGMVCFTRSVQ